MAGFLDLFNVIDSDGVSATKYRLHYLGSTLSRQDSWIFGMLTELVYVAFQLMVIPANALLGAVLNSSTWMGTLGEFYQKLTAPLFAVFPPWAIACFGLAIVAVSALRSKPGGGQPQGRGAPQGKSRGASMGMSSNALDRIGGALAMAAMVLVLTYNPFAMIAKVLELANGFSLGLANAVTSSGNDTTIATGQALVDASIRTPTIALNYGGEMTAACRTQWSQAMVEREALAESSGCFGAGANEASPGTLATAVIMLILPALPMLVFCVIAAWKYLQHLSLAVFHLLATAWVAAISVHKQRGFERLQESFARAASHLTMAVITSMLAVALPATVAGVGAQLLGLVSGPQAQAFVMMVSLGIGFGVSAWVINKVVSSHGDLARVLHADAGANLNALMGTDQETKLEFKSWNKWVADKKSLPPEMPGQVKAAERKAKRSALSNDPVSSTAPSRPTRDTVSSPNDDVEQLMEGAQSVADAGSQTTPGEPETFGSGFVGDTTAGAAVTAVTLVTNSTTGSVDTDAPATVDAANAAGDRYAYWVGGPTGTDGPDQGDPGDPVAPTLPTGPGDSPSGGSALADPPRSSLPDAGGAPPAVPGLLGADPALEAAARNTGATYVATPKPTPVRRVSSLLRRFTRSPLASSPAGAVPEVEYGPPLSPAPDPTAGATEALLPDTEGRPAGNDQQRWNRLRGVRDSFRRGDGAPAASDAGVEPVIGPDVRPDPGSFQAPQADFLAADDLLSQIDEVRNVSGAAGNPIDIQIDPNDRRLGIDFSSDPDERIRPSNPPGFGDPV
jgi:hypothetical protein